MAELTFRSPGVGTREIDLSGRTQVGPQGVPAAVIGTAERGPAFVPVTFASYRDFATKFGATDGEKFGPIAIQQWFANRQAGTYLKVLGAGDGKTRTTAGTVTNAGFTVGARQVQANGSLGDNASAYTGGSGTSRTYFLGCFMSESAGSTILSEAGIQQTSPVTTAATVTITANNSSDIGEQMTFVTTDGSSVTVTCTASTTDADEWGRDGSYHGLDNLKTCLEASSIAAKITVGSVAGSDPFTLLVTQNTGGRAGNTQVTSDVTNYKVSPTNTLGAGGQFENGTNNNAARPIVRGVLFAASGTFLTLSSSVVADNAAATVGATEQVKATDSGDAFTSQGASIGTVNPSTQEFVMLLNGLKQTDTEGANVLTASFDPQAGNYFPNVFNTDPFKIETEGHYLYRHNDIYSAYAVVTASGAGKELTVGGLEPAAFILSGALGKDTGDSDQPNYESFTDRFRHAFSPYVISQKFGGTPQNLFKVHCLDDGTYPTDKLKISVENVQKSNNSDVKFGKFDLVVREFGDDDRNVRVLESFRGLSIDPGSDRYFARVIGDMNTYYDFDQRAGSQKLVVDGKFPNASNYIRVEVPIAVDSGDIDQTALPVGYRGPFHLVTSGTNAAGTSLLSSTGSFSAANITYLSSSLIGDRAITAPIPFRRTVAVGTGIGKRTDAQLYWGAQFEPLDSLTEPNKNNAPILQKSPIQGYTKYFSHFFVSDRNPWVGDNAGTADDGGVVLDSDVFNKNKFTLENVQVVTATSTTDVVDSKEWQASIYRRDGVASSLTKADGTAQVGRFLDVTKDFGDLASKQMFKFSFFVQGGFDGVNVFNEDRSKMLDVAIKREIGDTNQGGTSGNTCAAYRKAVDILKEKSDAEIQLLAIPGIRQPQVTDWATDAIEDRFDALYLMDIQEKDAEDNFITGSGVSPNVTYTTSRFKSRSIDSSFAAAYFPDVIVTDPTTNTNVQVPPTVAVLGAFGLNDAVAHPWFAPAGFARGALQAVDVTVKTNRSNLDVLYDARINPITSFPGQGGPTIFGQKTLQAAESALDRINVRRLLIEIRRQVRTVANRFIFEPNRETTLARFSGAVNPILNRIQQQQGLDRYKVQIDTTTTTQADIENNTVRGKIFLQPTRSLEFISLDFVVSNAGAEI